MTTSEAESLPSLVSFPSPPADTIREPRGSIGLSGLPAQLGSLEYGNALDLAYAWQEGPAQAVAFALLELRRRLGNDPFSEPNEEPEENLLAELAKKLAAGEKVTDHSGDNALLHRWAQSDPAAACAAVLKAPLGECYSAAADEVADALAKLDPALGMDLVLQAGGYNKLGDGAAHAWAELSQRGAAEVPDGKNAKWYLQQMTGAQQDAMFSALAEEVKAGRYSDVWEAWGGFGQERSPLEMIAEEVLAAKHCGPGLEAFFEALAAYPEAAESIRSRAETRATLDAGPGYARAMQVLTTESIVRMDPGVAGSQLLNMLENLGSSTEFGPAAPLEYMSQALPKLLPNLMRSGHAAEAVQWLDRIEDRTVWRESFEAMLPAWMDADPAAARAAFEKAPLTALERERWERHPAFLLNP